MSPHHPRCWEDEGHHECAKAMIAYAERLAVVEYVEMVDYNLARSLAVDER